MTASAVPRGPRSVRSQTPRRTASPEPTCRPAPIDCAPSRAAPTRSSSSAPGSAGCRRRCTWPAPGAQVTVVERETVPGGRCGLLEIDGYRFDTGPTVLTMPDLIADAFAASARSSPTGSTLHRSTRPTARASPTASTIDVHADVDAMADEIAAHLRPRTTPTATGASSRFLRELYRHRDAALHRPQPRLARCSCVGPPLARLAALGGFGRLGRKVGAATSRDERLQRLFSFQAMYAGLAPAQALAHLRGDHLHGLRRAACTSPTGGMHAVPRALAGAAATHGVEFRYGTTVDGGRGHRRPRPRRCITADGERIPADVVVVNADLPDRVRATCCRRRTTPRRLRRLRYSPSAVVLHAGSPRSLSRTPPTTRSTSARRGTRRSTRSSTAAQADERPVVPGHDPDAHRPVARPGRPARRYYVLFPTPNLDHAARSTGPTSGPRYRDEMVATLEQRGYPGFGDGDRGRAPGHAGRLARAGPGRRRAVRGRAHVRPDRTVPRADARPARSTNLVFCGSNTQPGVGVPMVLISGRLAAERITGLCHDDRDDAPRTRELDAAGITDPALRASYARCRRINAEHGKTYFLATLLLPPAKRPYVHALYGFARHVDDIVDDLDPTAATAASAPQRLRRSGATDFLADLDWGATSDPVSRARASTPSQRWDIPHELLRRLPRLDADGPHRHRLRRRTTISRATCGARPR